MIPSWRLLGVRGIAEVITLAAAAISLIVVARSVGPAVLGDYALATAISQAGFIVVGLGTAASASRQVALERDTSAWWWSVVAIRIVPALAVAVLLFAVSSLVGGRWPAFGVAAAVSILAYVVRSEWLLIGSGAVLRAAWSRLASTLAMAVAAIAIVSDPRPADLVPWLLVVPNVVYPLASLSFVVAGRLVRSPPGAARLRGDSVALLRSAPGFVVGDVSTFIYSGLDRILLYLIASPVAAGLYDAAFKLIQPFYVISTVATDSMFRPLAAASVTPSPRIIGRYAGVMLVATVPLGPFLSIFSERIVTVVYGPGFADAAAILAILGWVITAGYLAGAVVLPMMAFGRPRTYATATAMGAGGSLAANVVLIPLLGGVGTAIAGVVAKSITGVVAYPEFRRITGASIVRFSAPYVAASVVAAVVAWPIQTLLTPTIGIVAFAAAYLMTIGLIRRSGRWSTDDRHPTDADDQIATDSNTRVTG